MNERDKELWNEAAKATKGAGDSWDAQVAFMQKFADLIRADEREALIRYFDGHWRDEWSEGQIIEALEARGNK